MIIEKSFDVFGPGGLNPIPVSPYLLESDLLLNDYRQAECDTSKILEWVNHQDSVFRRNRMQLLVSFPLLVPSLINKDNPVHMSNLVRMELESIIDRGDALIDALSQGFGVSKMTIRFLRGKSPSLVGNIWLEKVLELLCAIDMLPVELRPLSAPDWVTLRTYWECANLSGYETYRGRRSARHRRLHLDEHMFIGFCRCGYKETALNRLRRIAGGGLVQMKLTSDYFSFVDHWLDHVRIDNRDYVPSLAEALLMRYSLKDLLRQSAKWHNEVRHSPDKFMLMPEYDKSISWPGLLTSPFISQGLQAISLTCRNELEQEGHLLEHCVGSHAESCLRGTSHIISLRDMQGLPLSTVELELNPDAYGVCHPAVIQHFAKGNSTPDEGCVALLKEVLHHLNGQEVQDHLTHIHEIHKENQYALDAQLAALRAESNAMDTSIMKAVLPDFDEAMSWLNEHYGQSMT